MPEQKPENQKKFVAPMLNRASREQLIEQGPINKGHDSRIFENIINQILLKNKQIECDARKNYIFTLEAETGKKVTVNLTKMLTQKRVDFSLLRFDEEACDKAFAFLKGEEEEVSEFNGLTPGEILCIRRYTSGIFILMNSICRGNLKYVTSAQDLEAVLIYTSITAFALSKGTQEKIICTRKELALPKKTIRYLINLLKTEDKPPIFYFESLLSLSKDNNLRGVFSSKAAKVTFVIKNPIGMDIESISAVPEEKEFLMPPGTQLLLTEYKLVKKEERKEYVFTGEVVRGAAAVPAIKTKLKAF